MKTRLFTQFILRKPKWNVEDPTSKRQTPKDVINKVNDLSSKSITNSTNAQKGKNGQLCQHKANDERHKHEHPVFLQGCVKSFHEIVLCMHTVNIYSKFEICQDLLAKKAEKT